MSASRTRAHLRNLRQTRNLASLSQEDKKQSMNAVRSFVMFGGRRGHGTGGKFEVFAKRFPLAKDKHEAPAKRGTGLIRYLHDRIRSVKAKLQRRALNKRARKQRARA